MKLLSVLLASLLLSLSAIGQTPDTAIGSTLYGNTRDTMGIVSKPDQKASFPGGMKAWLQFVNRHIDLRRAAWDLREQELKSQTAVVQFVVCADGTVCEIGVINEVLPSVKKEAERLIRKSGKWIPAQKDGVAVKTFHKQPFTFVGSR